MPTEQEAIDAALAEFDRIPGMLLGGGYRVQVREILQRLYNAALWDPAPAPAVPDFPSHEIRTHMEMGIEAEKTTEADVTSELRGWWEQTAHDEIAQLTAKMVEYGGLSRATDLTEIGRHLTEVGVPKGPLLGSGAVQDGWLQELGIYFYLVGKFARWSAAIQEGRPVSDDTLLDIGIYVRMAQRIRAVGGWPV